MRIGIDASRAFLKQRTGIEEYSLEVIKHLLHLLADEQVILYVKKGISKKEIVASLGNEFQSQNWQIKQVQFKGFWTQVGLAWELLVDPVDVLFVPAHTVPWIHPQNTVVTVHGLEYEHCPESYSTYSRQFHRWFIKLSCYWSSKIIAVSQNTKKDLLQFYKQPEEKIIVIHNGFTKPEISQKAAEKSSIARQYTQSRYLLFLGRLEKRKNIENIIKAFDILKKQYDYPGQLLLAGKPGFGYDQIQQTLTTVDSRYDIRELGYISAFDKGQLLKNAEIFLFPSLCEGFGIPILEAQNCEVPVITSNFGPMDEVAGNNDILIDPQQPEEIARLANKILTNPGFKKQIITQGLENVSRFSWNKCAEAIKKVLIKS